MLSKTKSLKTKRKNKKGFTLVELVIVIAVLGIIAAIAIPTVTHVVNNANTSADESNAQAMELALKTYWSEIEANQITSPTADTATVSDALKAQGISSTGAVPTPKIHTNTFGYTSGGKIVSSGGTALTGALLLKTVMA